ncbi:MAG: sigma-70 family RNA polymerase sigma factor [Clostridia bacterium]|nr:sigma-70 family RNA polymerase sigma factor [Clostridia bacterium]
MKKGNEIKEYKNNNELDLEKIVNEYSNYLSKIIENMTNHYLTKEDKEEILLDTFFILWKNKDKLEDDKMLSSYLAGIIKNLIKEKSRVLSINYDIQDYENTIYDIKNTDMLYERREKIDKIREVLEQMKEEDIKIFKLYYYGGKKIKEIAQILNVSEFNVKTRLYRIRKRIKQDLEKGGYSDV